MKRADQYPPMSGAPLALATLALALATFMNVLDTTIANVSIPAIAGSLSVSPHQGTWVITSFAVATAIVVPLTGWLAKRIGEVRLFVSCTILFTAASTLCGFATSIEALIASRILQGAVAGPMIPLSQSLLLRTYPPEKKGTALALWAMTTVIAPIVGPIMGGYLTDNFGWPWIFYINIPVGVVSAYITWSLLKDRGSAVIKTPVDVTGLFLLFVAVASLQLTLDRGREFDWFDSPFIVTLAIVSAVAVIFFFIWEWYEENPVVDLSLLRIRNYTIGTFALAIGYATFFAGVVVFPIWLQTRMGYTATWAGLAAAPIGIMSFLLMPLVGKNLHKVDLRIFGTIAFGMFALVSVWMGSFNTDVTYFNLAAPRFVMGIAMACFFVPLTTISLAGLPPDRIAAASGLTNFIRITGGAFGASLGVTVWDHRTAYHYATLGEKITAYNPGATEFLYGGSSPLNQDQTLVALSGMVERQASTLAINDLFLLSALLFSSMMFLVWFTKTPFFDGKARS